MVLTLLLACAADAESPPAPAAPAPIVAPAADPPADACPADISTFVDPDPRRDGPAVIVIRKSARHVGLYENGRNTACYPVALAPGSPDGTKHREGDMATPEGWYRTSDRPWSTFYHAIHIHYPNASDADQALADGTITASTHAKIIAALDRGAIPPQDTAMGGLILIHGGGSSSDWTLGCVGLENADIDALREHLPADMATDVLILP